MTLRNVVLGPALVLLATGSFGCGSADKSADVSTRPATEEAVPFDYAGMYEVEGLTTVEGSGIERAISGKVVMEAEGEGYTSTFILSTKMQTPDGVVMADLHGNGEGRGEGPGLSGTAETQVTLGAAPGLDPKFPFLPGHFGPRIQSEWSARPAGDGRLELEITTIAAPGEEYQSTRTRMTAVRTTGPTEARTPDVAAAPR